MNVNLPLEREKWAALNAFLARSVVVLNGVIAIVLVVAFAIIGASASVLNFIFSVILGFIIALVTCGLVALAIEIHSELTKYEWLSNRVGERGPTHP